MRVFFPPYERKHNEDEEKYAAPLKQKEKNIYRRKRRNFGPPKAHLFILKLSIIDTFLLWTLNGATDICREDLHRSVYVWLTSSSFRTYQPVPSEMSPHP